MFPTRCGVVTDVLIEQDMWAVENVCEDYVKSSLEQNLRLQSHRDTIGVRPDARCVQPAIRQDPNWRPSDANWR